MSSAAIVENPVQRFDAQPLLVRRAAVLGAGTMGSRIAAHLANAGIPTLLLDLPAKNQGSESLALTAIDTLLKARPAAFYEPSLASLITPGTFDDDLPKLSGCDWVIEAVAENLEIKTALLARVTPHLAPHAVLTTNTSGLPIGQIGAALTSHRDRFFGTHFFNPPRYMRLLEIIPTPESDAGVVAAFAAFAGRMLGKQVVFANDTPNFIANRLGIALTFTAGNLMMSGGFGIEEVDALTGPVIGWPRTGIFRLADLVGIDILAHVAQNFPEGVTKNFPGGVAGGPFSALLEKMLERGWLGDKAGQGFYKKVKGADGKDARLVLDPVTFEYRDSVKPSLPTLEMAKTTESLASRLRILLKHDPVTDRSASFLWPVLASLWQSAADAIGVAAADVPSIDAAMRAGFNWEMGPFEMWDAVLVGDSVGRMRSLGLDIPPPVDALLKTGGSSWYVNDGRACFQPATGKFELVTTIPGQARVLDLRREQKWVRGTKGASLIDIGDGIGCIELHSLKNAVGEDVVQAIRSILDPNSESVRDFAGFVISGDRENFSVGANLMDMLLASQEGEWDELTAMVAAFQKMTSAIKFCPRPVVAAPFGLTLGGGAEICLAACRRQPHAELYMGLVEAGVGLIPAGGGAKEMLFHAMDEATALAQPDPPAQPNSKDPPSRFAQSAELATALRQRLELMAMAKVSTSAAEALTMGMLKSSDRVTLNRDRVLLDAKAQAATLAANGYMSPQPRASIPAPGTAALAILETGIFMMGEAGYASEHDQKVARWLAYILCGGRVTPGTLVTEQYILDLEREAFLSLLGERKTQQRIAYTLKTGKPLRN